MNYCNNTFLAYRSKPEITIGWFSQISELDVDTFAVKFAPILVKSVLNSVGNYQLPFCPLCVAVYIQMFRNLFYLVVFCLECPL